MKFAHVALLTGFLSLPGLCQAAASVGNTLEDFYTAALNYSPQLKIARERWNIGSARKDQSNGRLLPQVNANANISQNDTTQLSIDSSYNGERYSLTVSQVLFNWQAFESRRQAYLLEDQSEAEYYADLGVLLTDVADRYLNVLQAEDTLRSIESELEAMDNQIAQIQRLFDLQLALITNLYEAQARQAALQAERVNAESQLTLAREALSALTGIEVGSLSRLPETISIDPLNDELESWVQKSREGNPMIQARSYALEAANMRVSAQRGAYLPQVSLIYQFQQSDIGFQNIRTNRTENNYVGIDVQIPLFAGGSNRASVREAYSQRNIAEQDLRRAELEVEQRTTNAFLLVKNGESRISAGQVLAESTATSYAAMQRGYELNTVTSVDLLNSLRDTFNAERQLQQARYDHIRAHLLLLRESGTLSAEDLQEVSNQLNRR
jgi:outer membrane protein